MQKLLGLFEENQIKIEQAEKTFASFSQLEKIKKEEWKKLEEKAHQNKGKLWNDPVYRLAKITNRKNQTVLYLDKIDFKTHYATEQATELLKNLPFEKQPNGMYTSGYLETKDHFLMLGQRQTKRVITRAKISLIGGMLSPNERLINSGSDLFEAFLKELEEETGLKRDSVASIQGLGIYISDSGRIGVFFYCRLIETREELKEKIKLNQEHKAILFWPWSKLQKGLKQPEIHPNIKDSFEDCLKLSSSLPA